MARNPIVFQNGTLVSNAKVEIGGTIYDVTPAEYEGTTPLSANNLNQLQTNLYDYVDEKTQDIYSTSETVTNKIWNNKPVYRKIYIGDSISSNINMNVSNYEDIVDLQVRIRQNGVDSWRPLPWLFVQNNTMGTPWWAGGFYFSNGELSFQTGDTLKNIDRVVAIIEYTKTTD